MIDAKKERGGMAREGADLTRRNLRESFLLSTGAQVPYNDRIRWVDNMGSWKARREPFKCRHGSSLKERSIQAETPNEAPEV